MKKGLPRWGDMVFLIGGQNNNLPARDHITIIDKVMDKGEAGLKRNNPGKPFSIKL